MKERISFVFYKDWHDLLKDEDEHTRLCLYDAIAQYAFEGTLPQDLSIKMAFKLIKAAIDRDAQKFDDKVEKRKAAGRLGGLQRVANQTKQNQAKQANASNGKQNQAKQANQAENENENLNENENGNVLQDTNVSMCSNNITSPSNEEDVLQNEFSNSSKSVRFSVFVKLWNDNIKGTGQHAITDIKDGTQRRAWVSARLKEYGEDAVKQVIINATASSFLCGVNKKGVVYGFDWIMRPNNFHKVLEGNYNDKPKVVIAEPTPVAEVKSNTDYQDPVSQKNQNAAEYENWRRANGLPDNQATQLRFFQIKSRT